MTTTLANIVVKNGSNMWYSQLFWIKFIYPKVSNLHLQIELYSDSEALLGAEDERIVPLPCLQFDQYNILGYLQGFPQIANFVPFLRQ